MRDARGEADLARALRVGALGANTVNNKREATAAAEMQRPWQGGVHQQASEKRAKRAIESKEISEETHHACSKLVNFHLR